MLADAKKHDLLYVSSYGYYGDTVYVYTYPGGETQGELTGFELPSGECVDKSGDVFITNYNGADILEYAHGGTQPIATLKDAAYSNPLDCSIDPTTGNLAVTNAFGSSGNGNVAIYQGALGTPEIYSDPGMYEYEFCAYDKSGALFIDGLDTNLKFRFAELPKGSSSFIDITLPKIRHKYALGGIQWDGKHIALGNLLDDVVYRLNVSGSRARLAGSTALTDGNHVEQFSIPIGDRSVQKPRKLIGPNAEGDSVKIWQYPAGGVSIRTIMGIYEPIGTAVSPAKK